MMWVWCYNEGKNCLRVYRHLLTNSLHGKATELTFSSCVALSKTCVGQVLL